MVETTVKLIELERKMYCIDDNTNQDPNEKTISINVGFE